ncbi:MAG: hypothetical protein E6J64_04835 [Deltaproteobacteria bacterium]|nr:MAG: hypothetical protein E6J64_04835 [Deltaproteobacteria bacterium]
MSDRSPPAETPDLTLHQVAFARLSDGRVVARGTARELAYHRTTGGRLEGQAVVAALQPGPGTGYAMFGETLLTAPRVEGDLGTRRGAASGGVTFRASRGDHGTTDRLRWDGPADRLSGDRPVEAQGPGYQVRSQGFSARADGSDVTLTGGVAGTLQAKTTDEHPTANAQPTSRKPQAARRKPAEPR